MKEMKIEYLKIADIKPYKNNPRNNDEAVDDVAASIREFGFKVPIVIDRNNVVVTGHTRLKASKKLGLKKIPCIRADDLSEDQIKAFRLADNKVAELATWDLGKLEIELENIELDMEAFGFELSPIEEQEPIDIDEDDDDGWYGDERERTNKAYNLELVDHNNLTKGFWQMPIIRNDNYIPEDLIGFNYAKTNVDKRVGIHFYIDDYQFERLWNDPEKYVQILREYDCMLTPDFSLYMDMTMPTKIWNTYRSRLIGQYYQNRGIKVIPTVSWAEKETYKFCFLGIPKGSVVSVSTVGVKESEYAKSIWRDGMDEMIKRIKPSCILVYGGELEYDYKGVDVKYYKNHVTDSWKLSTVKED